MWAERITRCTVHGARISKGPFKQLKSSLRSRRKLRLVGPENGQKPVRVRSPWRHFGRDGRGCRLHFFQNWTIAGSRPAPEFPGNSAHYSRVDRDCKPVLRGMPGRAACPGVLAEPKGEAERIAIVASRVYPPRRVSAEIRRLGGGRPKPHGTARRRRCPGRDSARPSKKTSSAALRISSSAFLLFPCLRPAILRHARAHR